MKKLHFKKQSLFNSVTLFILSILLSLPGLVRSQESWLGFGNNVSTTNFIGSRNNEDFRIRTNNLQRMVVTKNGLVGIGAYAPVSLFSVGDSSQFQVNLSGDLSMIHNVPYSFPSLQGAAGTVLQNNGDGILTWAPGGGTGGGNNWSITGNSGTTPENFVGTTDNKVLDFRTAGILRTRITTKGQIETYNTGKSVFIGEGAGASDDLSEKGNVFVGYQAGKSNTKGSENIAIGYQALYSDSIAPGNIAIGYQALNLNTNGGANIAIGTEAMRDNTTGVVNTAIGNLALVHNTIGSDNTATGNGALEHNDTGADNTATGMLALRNNQKGTGNTAIGSYTMVANTTGDGNTAIGAGALGSNTEGNGNTALGTGALGINISGAGNIATGGEALGRMTSGIFNTANGQNALYSNITGSYNTALGFMADVSAGNLLNSTAIGSDASVNASNNIVIGNSAVTVIGGYANWSNLSDERFKQDINENVPGLKFITHLHPVLYRLNLHKLNEHIYGEKAAEYEKAMADGLSAKEKIVYSGFIAQEVEQAAKAIDYNFSGVVPPQNDKDHYSLSYADFVVPLVKAIQEQQAMIEELKKQVAALQAETAALNKKR
jgi:hypothetical protein